MIVLAAAALMAETAPVLSLRALEARHEALAGRTVRVRGVLDRCAPEGCYLTDGETMLSLGRSAAFDREVAGLGGRAIVVEGWINAYCFSQPPADLRSRRGVHVICLDRAEQLRAPRLIADIAPAPKLKRKP